MLIPIVGRLRSISQGPIYGGTACEAADTIDALVAALEYARRQLNMADHDIDYIDAALALARGGK